MRRIDLTGKKFGMITVLGYAGPLKHGTGWNARCDCGTEFVVNGGHLTQKGYAKRSCGCLRTYGKDMIGKTYGRLTPTRAVPGRAPNKRKTLLCDCECGTTGVQVSPHELRAGHTRSCGCLVREPHAIDRLGDRYGKLVVLGRGSPTGEKPVMWECLCDCGNIDLYHGGNLATGNSTQCEPCRHEALAASNASGVSAGEKEMLAYIESLGFQPRHGRVPGTDGSWLFDAVVDERKVAFEFNGVYWHSYPRTRRGRHSCKREYAERAGYRMVTVWEDDWAFDREKAEALIRRVLTGAKSRGAREFDVREVDLPEAKEFHKRWHLQGYNLRIAASHYALTDKGVPVAAATISRKGVLERYTVVEGLAIPGGLLRLIKAFRKDQGAVDITTFCDRDYFDGRVYRQSGFRFAGTELQMWFVRQDRRESRQKYMKRKLPALFGTVDMSKSAIEICADNRVYAAYNSGTDKYILPGGETQ